MSNSKRRSDAGHFRGVLLICAVTAFVVSPQAWPQGAATEGDEAGELVDYVVATVNGSPITLSALTLERRLRDLTRDEALDALIDKHLFLEEAATFIIVSDAGVSRSLAELRTTEGAAWEQYARRLMLEGVPEAELRDRIREQLMLDQLVARLFRPQIAAVTTSDVEAYYNTHVENLQTPAVYRTRRIQLSLPSSASEAAKTEARREAERVRRELVEGGTSIEVLRKELANNPTISIRMDAVWRTAEDHARELAEVLPTLAPGEWSAPISTPLGFFLVQAVEVKAAETRQLDVQVSREIAGVIEASRLQPIMEAWLKERRAESDIRTVDVSDTDGGDSR